MNKITIGSEDEGFIIEVRQTGKDLFSLCEVYDDESIIELSFDQIRTLFVFAVDCMQ